MANRFTISTVFDAVDRITGPVTAITRKVDELGASSEKAKKQLSDDFKAAGAAIASIGAVAVAASAAVFGLAKSVSDAGDDIAKTSAALGMSGQALQEYRYIAERSGVSVNEMDNALQKMQINLGKEVSGELANALELLNLSAEDLKAAGPERSLELIADAMKNVTNPADRSAAAVALFGRSGARMVNVLAEGSDGIAQLRQEANELGYILGADALDASESFNDSFLDMQLAFKGITNTLGAAVMPKIEQLIIKITESLKPGGDLRALMDELSAAFDFMAKVAGVVINVLIGLFKVFKPIAPIIIGIVAAIASYNTIMAIYEAVTTAAAVAQAILNGTMTANPIGLIVVAIGALIGVIILMVKHWDEVVVVLAKIWEVIKGVGQAFLKYLLMPINLVMDAIGGLLGLISKIPGVGDKLKPALEALNGFQAAMNEKLTGTEGAYDFSGIEQNVNQNVDAISERSRAPESEASAGNLGIGDQIKQALAGGNVQQQAPAAPVSSQTSTITRNNNSTVDVNFNNPPAGTSVRARGPAAPGINLNLGATGGAR